MRDRIGSECLKNTHIRIMGRITELVRQLRKNATPEEQKLWQALRGRKLGGKKFLRQQPIIYDSIHRKFFVADFYCAETKLVIELDGRYHDFQQDYDQNRDSILQELGLRVLRIKNEELSDLGRVLEKIDRVL